MMAGLVALLLTAPPPVDLGALERCEDSLDVAIFVSPRLPYSRVPMTVMVVSDTDLSPATLVARDPSGTQVTLPETRYGGPPFGRFGRVAAPAEGMWRLALVREGRVLACQDTRVRRGRSSMGALVQTGEPAWRSRIKWERDTENLYSLWIEHLFSAPATENPTWTPLHVATRNGEKNLLFNHLNLGEDGEGGLRLAPDCADFPYFLRAYFAWKMGLPFGFRGCSRGNARRAPTCGAIKSNAEPTEKRTRVSAFRDFVGRLVAGHVHSSSGRTAPDAERSDYYPVALSRRGVRPGAIFADPYGHVLVVAGWHPQRDGKPGVLFAVDAQPDATVGRRRFWRGSFLFPEDGAVTGAGFKRFRPVVRTGTGHTARSNAWIAASVDYGDFSVEQWAHGQDAFYERMDALINPTPMSPEVALDATLDALAEQVVRRAMSVDTGEEWKAKHPGRVIPMPEGPEIFQTAGPWEDFSTPSRDLRLLIAIQSVLDYPGRIVRHPHRFALPAGTTPEAARAAAAARLQAEAGRRRFEYTRSDGSRFALTVSDVIARRQGLEVAYNPNDCPEVRWAAPEGAAERATCVSRAPDGQRARMERYRAWFAQRRRPLVTRTPGRRKRK